MCVCVRLNVVIQKRLSLCSDILGSISVAWGVNWSCHSSSRQAWWSRGMFRGLGVGVGGSSCFNCLRSLANSLGLECVWPLLSLLHTPALALCARRPQSSSSWEDSRSGFFETGPNIARARSQSRRFSLSHSSPTLCPTLSMVFFCDWLTPLILSFLCDAVFLCTWTEWKLSKFNSLYVLCVKFQFNSYVFFQDISTCYFRY